MIQRISVRIRLISDNKTLLVRGVDSKGGAAGYNLPGGRVLEAEQPDAAAKRFLTESLGLSDDNLGLRLEDVVTYVDRADRVVQYAVIVYRVIISKKKRLIKLGSKYDKYVWYSHGKVDQDSISELGRILLGTDVPLAPTEDGSSSESTAKPQAPVVFTDGGSRGNPGPSAAGYVIIENGKIIDQGGEYIGITTNNQAEYHGVRIGLEAARRLGLESVEVRVDSMLVANQLNGIYKIKNRELWPLNERVRELVDGFQKVKFSYIPREMNQLADGMVNRTLDQQKGML